MEMALPFPISPSLNLLALAFCGGQRGRGVGCFVGRVNGVVVISVMRCRKGSEYKVLQAKVRYDSLEKSDFKPTRSR